MIFKSKNKNITRARAYFRGFLLGVAFLALVHVIVVGFLSYNKQGRRLAWKNKEIVAHYDIWRQRAFAYLGGPGDRYHLSNLLEHYAIYDRRRVAEAKSIIESLAEQEDYAPAQYALAKYIQYYPQTERAPQQKKIRLLRSAAEQEHLQAMVWLQRVLREEGQPHTDYKEAAYWLKELYIRGWEGSAIILGELYLGGAEGVPANTMKAEMWLEQAIIHSTNPKNAREEAIQLKAKFLLEQLRAGRIEA